MLRNKGILLVWIGTVLLFAALSLFLYNQREDSVAGEKAELLLHKVQAIVEERERKKISPPEQTALPVTTLPEIEIEGYQCVGILSLPKLEIELPVLSDWDYHRLAIAPCRQSGSIATNDLVIAAHNYPHHFGMLKELKQGDSIVFTDINGSFYHYTVNRIETLSSTAVDSVLNSDSDLVLYTCTKGGAMRVAVFCDRSTTI